MLRLVALDTGPLGILTNPNESEVKTACLTWLDGLIEREMTVLLPEVADFELRREFQRNNNRRSERKLDLFAETLIYLPIGTEAMRRAATLWAQLRQTGRSTGHPHSLDADCILVAQIQIDVEKRGLSDGEWIIATSDIGDLPRLAPAARWNEISRS